MLEVSLLGCGGMMPLPGRHLTSMCVRHNGSMLLVDAGEGTQVTLKQVGWGFKSIDTICFTHYHADHISGLPGLLLTIGNSNREAPLHLIGPKGLRHVVQSLLVIAPELPFALKYTELDAKIPNRLVLETGIVLSTHPMTHHVPCLGFCLELPRIGKFDQERARALGLPVQYWGRLQRGESFVQDGHTYTPCMVLGPPRKGLKLCYCTDSRPPKGIVDFVRGADLFICEGLYGDEAKFHKAIEHRHMMFQEAADIAKKAGVRELWLTHFSPALVAPQAFLKNATDIFPNTLVGRDRLGTTLVFEE